MNDELVGKSLYYGIARSLGKERTNTLLAGMFLHDSDPDVCEKLMEALPSDMRALLRQNCDQQAGYLREAIEKFESALEEIAGDAD